MFLFRHDSYSVTEIDDMEKDDVIESQEKCYIKTIQVFAKPRISHHQIRNCLKNANGEIFFHSTNSIFQMNPFTFTKKKVFKDQGWGTIGYFYKKNEILVVGNHNKSIIVDTKTGSFLKINLEDEVNSVKITDDMKYLFCVGQTNFLFSCKIFFNEGKIALEEYEKIKLQSLGNHVDLSPNQKYLAVSTDYDGCYFFEREGSKIKQIDIIDTEKGTCDFCCFNSKSNLLLSCQRKNIAIYSIQFKRIVKLLKLQIPCSMAKFSTTKENLFSYAERNGYIKLCEIDMLSFNEKRDTRITTYQLGEETTGGLDFVEDKLFVSYPDINIIGVFFLKPKFYEKQHDVLLKKNLLLCKKLSDVCIVCH